MSLRTFAVAATALTVVTVLLPVKPAVSACVSSSCTTVTVGGVQYDISTINSSDYKGDTATLQSILVKQPWWQASDISAPYQFVTAVGSALGFVNEVAANGGNTLSFGPYFAYTLSGGSDFSWIGYQRIGTTDLGTTALGLTPLDKLDTYYAVVSPTAVPTPALLPGLLGFGWAVTRRKLRNS
jgi:hypothetical protein